MQCFDCGFSTTKPCNWQTHLRSQRHLAITGHACVCTKIYATIASLRRHEKTCPMRAELGAETTRSDAFNGIVGRFAQAQSEREDRIAQEHLRHLQELANRDARLAQLQSDRDARVAKELAERDAKRADEIASLRAELAARPTTVMHNTNCTFNLSVFLNETCKNAQTIEQFMGGIPLRMNSEQSMGQYILESLNSCAVEDRPIHCTDVKRGKLAVKNGSKGWEQDQANVEPLVHLNVNTLRQRYMLHLANVWCPEHPAYETDERLNAEWVQFLTMMCADLDAKFMNHLAKATSIPKS